MSVLILIPLKIAGQKLKNIYEVRNHVIRTTSIKLLVKQLIYSLMKTSLAGLPTAATMSYPIENRYQTIFLCQHLDSEAVRREINEGLNVVERWNGVNEFIFYGKGGEFASNRLESQELSVLSLHLLQICLVYVNTLMIQSVLTQKHWHKRLTARDLQAITPLIFSHVNPYGLFKLDMKERISRLSQPLVA